MLSRHPCLKCESEELHRSVAGRVLCCQCDTQWRPLTMAEHLTFNSRVTRARAENADNIARTRARNNAEKIYMSTCDKHGPAVRYVSNRRCLQCSTETNAAQYAARRARLRAVA